MTTPVIPPQGSQEAPGVPYELEYLEKFVGRAIGESPWLDVDQAAITRFGEVTLDPDPNHVDPVWAFSHSPFGRTVAFGFQTLAYLTHLGKRAGMVPGGVADEVNYGLERVRFVEPVPAGAQIRARVVLKAVRRRTGAEVLATYAVNVDIKGAPKPALVADWLILFQPVSRADT